MKSIKLIALSTIFFILFTNLSVSANGKKYKLIDQYKATIPISKDLSKRVDFSTDIDLVIFNLTSIQNKYKIIQINVRNWSGKVLQLSSENDKIEIHVDGRVIPGLLDLSNNDPTFWDGLDSTSREILAYPKTVDSGEEENIFVFLPNKIIRELPPKIVYTISSISEKAVLHRLASLQKK